MRSAYSNGKEIVSLWYRAFIDPAEAATLVQIHNAQSFEPRLQFEIPGLLLALPYLSDDGRYLAVRDASGVPPSAYLIDLQDAVTTSLNGVWPVAPEVWTWSIATGPFASLTGEGAETRLAIVDRFIDDPQAEAKRSFVDAQIAELEDRGLAAVFSDDLSLFAIAYVEDQNSRIRVLDLITQSVIASFATHGRVEALGFDLERNQITALERVETRSAPYFSAWSFRAGQKTGEGVTIGDARLAPEFIDRHSRFALGQVPGTGNTLRVLDLTDGSAPLDGFDLGTDAQDLYQSAISTNGETAILVQDTAISVVDVADTRVVFSTPLDDFIQVTRVGGLAVSDDGAWAAYAFEGEIIVINARTGTEHARLLVLETPNPIISLAFLAESTDLAFSHPTGIAGVWPIDAPEAKFQIRAADRLEFDDLSVSEDGRWVAVEVFRSLNTVAVHIYDTATGALVRALDMPANTDGTLVKSHFSSDGTRLAARGPGGEIFLWDTATGILILRLSLEPGTGQVTGFTEDGEGLITWDFPAQDAAQEESAQSFVWSLAHLAQGSAYKVACDLLSDFDLSSFNSLDITLTDPICVSETTKGAP